MAIANTLLRLMAELQSLEEAATISLKTLSSAHYSATTTIVTESQTTAARDLNTTIGLLKKIGTFNDFNYGMMETTKVEPRLSALNSQGDVAQAMYRSHSIVLDLMNTAKLDTTNVGTALNTAITSHTSLKSRYNTMVKPA